MYNYKYSMERDKGIEEERCVHVLETEVEKRFIWGKKYTQVRSSRSGFSLLLVRFVWGW